MRAAIAVLGTALLLAFPASARAEFALYLVPPVDATVSSRFDPPLDRFGSGHRGIDYDVPAGTAVRAAADGVVSFAGSVAGDLAVTIDHGSGVETTYTILSEVSVAPGERVTAVTWIGRSGQTHGRDALHFGIKLHGAYVDPERLLGPLDITGAIHLAPTLEKPDDMGGLEDLLVAPASAGSAQRDCEMATRLAPQDAPPNDNVVVAVAGITSKTAGGVDAAIYEHAPAALGYPEERTYRFSYAGLDTDDLHEPYDRTDTYIDLHKAAAHLRALMVAVHDRHPDAQVDLIAHSQGGIVARLYLVQAAQAWDDALPDVEHLITYSSPHEGAPAAAEGPEMERRTLTGRWALDALSDLSAQGVPVPDPDSPAVTQLAPGSDLMEHLDGSDVSFGTRVLTLAVPNDPIVPADHAQIPEHPGRVIPWEGHPLAGHSTVVDSATSRALAYQFLRDDAPACPSGWDRVGPAIGRSYSAFQSHLDWLYGKGEERVVTTALGFLRVPPPVARAAYRSAVEIKQAIRNRLSPLRWGGWAD
ncbi:MAG: peptidoglycan DD-metalloendopeptidase family protein [Actinomycetota bacterium]